VHYLSQVTCIIIELIVCCFYFSILVVVAIRIAGLLSQHSVSKRRLVFVF